MTTRYVGPGGNDANSGLTWALRKLTLNGVEDTPVVAGDEIVVGPGVYRETLTVDVSGAAGSPITYTADVTGQRTDGVGDQRSRPVRPSRAIPPPTSPTLQNEEDLPNGQR